MHQFISEKLSVRILKILRKNSMGTPVNDLVATKASVRKLKNLRKKSQILRPKLALSFQNLHQILGDLGKEMDLGRERRSHEGCILCKKHYRS